MSKRHHERAVEAFGAGVIPADVKAERLKEAGYDLVVPGIFRFQAKLADQGGSVGGSGVENGLEQVARTLHNDVSVSDSLDDFRAVAADTERAQVSFRRDKADGNLAARRFLGCQGKTTHKLIQYGQKRHSSSSVIRDRRATFQGVCPVQAAPDSIPRDCEGKVAAQR
jgi:hypothetical protein